MEFCNFEIDRTLIAQKEKEKMGMVNFKITKFHENLCQITKFNPFLENV